MNYRERIYHWLLKRKRKEGYRTCKHVLPNDSVVWPESNCWRSSRHLSQYPISFSRAPWSVNTGIYICITKLYPSFKTSTHIHLPTYTPDGAGSSPSKPSLPEQTNGLSDHELCITLGPFAGLYYIVPSSGGRICAAGKTGTQYDLNIEPERNMPAFEQRSLDPTMNILLIWGHPTHHHWFFS